MSTSNCRFYENKYPEVEEVVMVNVQQIAEMGAYVKLLEYDNIEGMVLLSELSRRRIRSIQKLIRVGRNEVVVVLRVDKEKGYIDLSKRRVSSEDIVKCEERYNKSKAVHSILRHCAEKFSVPLETLYETIGWPLSKEFGHAYDAFKISITEPSVFDKIVPPSPDILEELKGYISRRLTPQAIKCRADVEVSCFSYEGIDAIKEALSAAEALSTEQHQIKVKLVAAPRYVLTTQSLDKQKGIEILEEAVEKINEKITKFGGACNVTMAPKAVTATEDAELQALLERKEEENAQDSDDSEDDDEED
ncbi:unnamed protein product [Kuraishia capsulata CBS 1993]|uniref:Eukaryotic translation initiation factor 2 subunit alpha n=1 Tax=Kuraishia capsulata CBS 1993 TaxID=1382522 RepID=W6MN60_9ASCO|nr:uncharacterized protein KUCA_T00003672001 [Kuraishia capsulata CBS 1993]CDK27693.1 unnamed protein product [Kuraishia capsulata CBS 1993]